MKGDYLKGHLDLLVLSVLADSPAHGYAVIEELKQRSSEAIEVPEGTLYPALHRLEKAGLIVSNWDEAKGRPRKSYRLTPAGRRQLSAEKQTWNSFVTAVAAITGSRS